MKPRVAISKNQQDENCPFMSPLGHLEKRENREAW
jgi:hypothetical protein